MALIKWNPVNSMDLFGDFDSMMNDFFFRPSRLMKHSDVSNWRPRIDVLEKEKEYQVVAELPGLDKNDINVSVKDDVLTISGEKKFEEHKNEENYFCCERRFGKFERSFRMADRIEADKIKAEFKNGILKLSVPKVEIPEPESTRIQIK